jgi:hypothetical protein
MKIYEALLGVALVFLIVYTIVGFAWAAEIPWPCATLAMCLYLAGVWAFLTDIRDGGQ